MCDIEIASLFTRENILGMAVCHTFLDKILDVPKKDLWPFELIVGFFPCNSLKVLNLYSPRDRAILCQGFDTWENSWMVFHIQVTCGISLLQVVNSKGCKGTFTQTTVCQNGEALWNVQNCDVNVHEVEACFLPTPTFRKILMLQKFYTIPTYIYIYQSARSLALGCPRKLVNG